MNSSATKSGTFLRQIKSFVRRDGRMTEAQKRAYQENWPKVGLELTTGLLDTETVFQRKAPTVLEIGFGNGISLLAMAKANPDHNVIGVETHLPGIGNLLLNMEREQVGNLRVYYADAVKVLTECIPSNSLETVQIFFPDPWPKRRHHKRRLIQPEFVQLIASKLKPKGTLHLASDWQDYAVHMLKVLSLSNEFHNLAGNNQYATRSSQRPLVTKFESRGHRSGFTIWELQFERIAGNNDS